jgi:hypothetical protein
MSISLEISQEAEIRIDWDKLAKDLKEEFNIDTSEEEIEVFCSNNESKYLVLDLFEQEIEKTHTNDQTGDVFCTD